MIAGAVLIDRNARTAIVITQGRKLTHLVPLEEGELTVRPLSQADLEERGFRPMDYPLKRAVRIYLRHSGGVSTAARKALKGLVKQEEKA